MMNDSNNETADERMIVSGRVSAIAADGWRTFCEANGISLSGFLEAAGLALAKETFPPSIEARRALVEEARRVDLRRRSRRR